MNKFYDIIEWSKDLQNQGKTYFTEDFSLYFYSLIRMTNPNLVVELGTGLGTTSFLAAQACKENNNGKVITFDNFSQWVEEHDPEKWIKDHIEKFDLQDRLFFIKAEGLDIHNNLKEVKEINIFFNDINCEPVNFLKIMGWMLPRVNKEAYLFIDGGATYWPSYCIIEMTLEKLNAGKIPKTLYEFIENPEDYEKILKRFTFSNIYLKKFRNNGRNQNSVAMIKIQECDILEKI